MNLWELTILTLLLLLLFGQVQKVQFVDICKWLYWCAWDRYQKPGEKPSFQRWNSYPPVLLRKEVIAPSFRTVEKMQVKHEFKLLKDANLKNS